MRIRGLGSWMGHGYGHLYDKGLLGTREPRPETDPHHSSKTFSLKTGRKVGQRGGGARSSSLER